MLLYRVVPILDFLHPLKISADLSISLALPYAMMCCHIIWLFYNDVDANLAFKEYIVDGLCVHVSAIFDIKTLIKRNVYTKILMNFWCADFFMSNMMLKMKFLSPHWYNVKGYVHVFDVKAPQAELNIMCWIRVYALIFQTQLNIIKMRSPEKLHKLITQRIHVYQVSTLTFSSAVRAKHIINTGAYNFSELIKH